MSDFIQITTTCDKKEILQAIATKLVESRLAACVQIGGPMDSVFRWEGNIESASEWICTIKSVAGHQANIESVIFENHSYDQPEIIVVPITGGSQGYLNWIKKQTSEAG